jgi:hypothetical protein
MANWKESAKKSLENRNYVPPEKRTYELGTNTKTFGTVSYGAKIAIENNTLDSYKPKNDEEKKAIDQYKQYTGMFTNNGTSGSTSENISAEQKAYIKYAVNKETDIEGVNNEQKLLGGNTAEFKQAPKKSFWDKTVDGVKDFFEDALRGTNAGRWINESNDFKGNKAAWTDDQLAKLAINALHNSDNADTTAYGIVDEAYARLSRSSKYKDSDLVLALKEAKKSWGASPLTATGKNVKAAVYGVAGNIASFTDSIGGKYIPGLNSLNDSVIEESKKAQEEAANYNKGFYGEGLGTFTQGVVNLLPYYFLGGGSAATNTLSKAPQYATYIKTIAKNPSFWYSLTSMWGQKYQEALDGGATEADALKNAILYSVPAALVEVSGGVGSAKGPEKLSTTIIEEIGEEIAQDIISGAADKATTNPTLPVISFTEDAVINPVNLAKTAIATAPIVAVAGGANVGINKVVNLTNQRIQARKLANNKKVVDSIAKFTNDVYSTVSSDNADISKIKLSNSELTKVGALYSDEATLEVLIAEGLESPSGTVSRTLAEELDNKLKAKEKISNKEIGKLVVENIKQIVSEQVTEEKTKANTKGTNIEENNEQSNVPYNVLAKPELLVGDIFKDTKTGNYFTVVNRDNANTTVEVETPKGTVTKVFSNAQADNFVESGQVEKINDSPTNELADFKFDAGEYAKTPVLSAENETTPTETVAPQNEVTTPQPEMPSVNVGDVYVAGDKTYTITNRENGRTTYTVTDKNGNTTTRVTSNVTADINFTKEDAFTKVQDGNNATTPQAQNKPTTKQTIVNDGTTVSTEENVVDGVKIADVVDAMNETFVDGAIERIFQSMERTSKKTGVALKKDITTFAEAVVRKYNKHGLGHIADYFVDKGAKVISVIEDKTSVIENTVVAENETTPNETVIPQKNEVKAVEKTKSSEPQNTEEVLQNQPKSDTKNKKDNAKTHPFDAELDNVLRIGSGTEGGKERIVEFYKRNPSKTDAVKFLKKEYSYYGCTYIFPDKQRGFMSSNDKGIELYISNADSRQFSWTEIDNRLRQLIADEKYLTSKETESQTKVQAQKTSVETKTAETKSRKTTTAKKVSKSKTEATTNVNLQENEILALKKSKNVYSLFKGSKKVIVGKDVIVNDYVALPLTDKNLDEIKKVVGDNLQYDSNLTLDKYYLKDNDVVIQGNPKLDDIPNGKKTLKAYVFKIGDTYYACQQKFIDTFNNGKNVITANENPTNAWTVHDENGNFVSLFMPMNAYTNMYDRRFDGLQSVSDVLEMKKQNKSNEERYSLSSMGASFFGNEDITADEFQAMLEDGSYKEYQGYKDYVKDIVNVYAHSRGITKLSESNRAEIEREIEGIIKVAIASKKAGYDIYDDGSVRDIKDSKKRLLFSSLEPNSDYITSSDISTICDKRKNFAEIYEEIVRLEESRGVPADKRFFNNVDNYFILHKLMADKGLTVPCEECYVESMRKNLAPMAKSFLELVTETNPENKSNSSLYNEKGEIKKNNAKIRDKVRDLCSDADSLIKLEDITIEMLTTADGLARLRLQAPLLYETFNSFYGQSKPKMPREATPFRPGELIALMTDSKGRISTKLVNQIKSTGGFRLQSYSDFQIKNYVDVLQTIFEASMLGLNGHAYTKVPAFLEATDGTNLKRNVSIFMYEDDGKWVLDKKNSFPMDLEDIYTLVASDESGNTSIIAVSQNADMSAWIMANDFVGYGIPFHKSGLKMEVVRGRVVKTADGREVLGYAKQKDHTSQQSEVWKKTLDEKRKENTKVKKPIDIYKFWDFENKDNLSKQELIEKNLKAYIDECNKRNYRPKFREYLMNNESVLNNVLSYAKELGFVSQNATIEDISFKYDEYTIPYGYYKFIGDFGMFKPDGTASPIETLSLENYDFDKAEKFFEDSKKLRTNELLQQFENGTVREEYREKINKGELTTEQLESILKETRNEIAQKVVNRTDDGTRYSIESKDTYAPTFYSHMGKTINEMKQEKVGANSVVSYLKGRGVKDEEIKWSGIEEFLEGKKSVTKAELQEFVAGSMLQIEEVTLDNTKIPYTQEQSEQIAEYESQRNEIFEELKQEWQKTIGTEFPMQTFGLGLESSVVNLIMETNRQIKESNAGYEYEGAKEDLWDIFEEDDFGFDSEQQAFYEAIRTPREFMEDFELTDEQKAIFERFISAKENLRNAEGIPVETQRHIRDIASKADEISRKISRIRAENNMENEKQRPKWYDYKIEGGKNYREVIFKMHNSTYSNPAMKAHWNDSNADGGGVLAHARIQDFDVDGKKMLFVEEIQSDWHNEGHKTGYKDGSETTLKGNVADLINKRDAIEKSLEDIKDRVDKAVKSVNDRMPLFPQWVIYGSLTNQESEYDFSSDIAKSIRDVATDDELAIVNQEADLNKELKDLNREIEKLERRIYDSAPDAPFRDNYHEYVLKRLIRMAAEQGYDSIGWTPADVQSARWSEEYAEGYRIEYDQDIPKFLNKYGKKWGAKVGRTQMEIDGVSEIEYFVDDHGNRNYSWSKLFDDVLTRNGVSEESSKDYIAFWSDDETIKLKNDKDGSYLDEEIHYKSEPASVWSMPITDSMRDSVLYEGQTLYSLEKEGNNNERQNREDLLSRNGRGTDNESSRKQTERIQEFKQKNKGKTRAERQSFAKKLLERGQTEEVIDGRDKYTLIKPEAYNDDMLTMVEDAKSKGYELGFFVGSAKIKFDTKDEFVVNGIINGSKILLRYDHFFSPQVLFLHERGHAKWNTPEMQTVKERVMGDLSEDEKQTILAMDRYADYMEIYDGNEDRVWEEFVVDMMSGMNTYTANYIDLVADYWAENTVAEGYDASTYAESVDAGGKQTEAEYLELAKNPEKNEIRLRELVDDVAVKSGVAVDNNGKPLALYHGTPTYGFTKFDRSRIGSNSGVGRGVFSFTTNKQTAEAYSGAKADSNYGDANNLVDGINKLLRKYDSPELNGLISYGEADEVQEWDADVVFDNADDFVDFDYDTDDFDSYDEYKKAMHKAQYEGYVKYLNSIFDDYQKDAQGQFGDFFKEVFNVINATNQAQSGVYSVFILTKGNKVKEYSATIETYNKVAWDAVDDGNDVSIINLDNGEQVYFVKNSEDIKSADLVTYDDDGNIIPLSERFKSNNDDIRYSLADDGILDLDDLWDDAIEKYGTIPKGENPVRDIDVPQKISEKDVVSHFARTMIEAEVTPDWAVSEFEKAIVNGEMTHEVIPNKKAHGKAINKIKTLGFDEALNYWSNKMKTNEAINEVDFAMGLELYNQCVTNKDAHNAMKIAAELSAEATRSARNLQLVRLLKKMSPDGQLYYLEKSIQKMNEEFKDKLGKKHKDIELNEDLMEEFFNAEDEAKRDEAYDRICQDIADQIPSTFRDHWNSWRYLAMLGNPRTHFRNLFGNAVFIPAIRIKNFVGAFIEKVARVNVDERTKSFHKRRDAVKFAKEDAKNKSVKKMLQGENAKYAVTGDVEGKRTIFKSKAFAWLEWIRRKNFDLLEGEDWLFLKSHYVDALARLITARKIDITKLDAKKLDTLRAYAVKEAQTATYRDANALADGLNRLQKNLEHSNNRLVRTSSILVEGVMPFKKTPMNIAKQGIIYSPIGILNGTYKAFAKLKSGDATATEVIDDFAKGMTGTAAMLFGLWLASMGVLVGAKDEPDKEKEFNQMVGEQDYSINIGDWSYTIDWATPSILSVFVGAKLHELCQNEFSFSNLVSAISTIPEPLLELSVFSGVEDVIESAKYSNSSPVMAIATNVFTNYLTQALPTIGGQISRITDETKREYYYVDKNKDIPRGLQTLMGKAASKIPGLSFLFEPAIDNWGRDETYGIALERVPENLVSPGYYSEKNYTEVDEELKDLYERTGETSVFPITQQKYYEQDYIRYDMTAEEYTEAKRMRGQKSFEYVSDLLANKRETKLKNSETGKYSKKKYSAMTDEEKVKAIKKCYESAGDETKEYMLEKIKQRKASK